MRRLEDLHGVLLGHISTIEYTYHICKTALELRMPGAFVECGVFAGAQSAAMARAIMDIDGSTPRQVHLFDSFAGIPAAGEHDHDLIAADFTAGTALCSLAQVKWYMEREWHIPESLLVYHPGWFADTLPTLGPDPEQIAVLRIDCDLYESTRLVMEHLYPRVVPGGFVIVDDYNLDGCRKALHEYLTPAPIYFRKN